MKVLLAEEKLENTIRRIPQDSVTVIDVIKTLRHLYPEDWGNLVERFQSIRRENEDTLPPRTFRTGLTSTPKSLAPCCVLSRSTTRASLKIAEGLLKRSGSTSAVRGL